MRTTLRISKADDRILYAFLDVVAELISVDIRVFKPRLSRTFNIDIEGDSERVKEAERILVKFASKAGWKVQA